jgi:hypothetical protein
MGNGQKILFSLAGLLLASLISLIWSHNALSQSKDNLKKSLNYTKTIRDLGELIYQHQKLVKFEGRHIDSQSKGEFNAQNLLLLETKHKLKHSIFSDKTTKRKTYSEKVFSLTFKDEPLKDILLFLLDAEALGNVKVSYLKIIRNPKNKDLWSCQTSIVRRDKKDATS